MAPLNTILVFVAISVCTGARIKRSKKDAQKNDDLCVEPEWTIPGTGTDTRCDHEGGCPKRAVTCQDSMGVSAGETCNVQCKGAHETDGLFETWTCEGDNTWSLAKGERAVECPSGRGGRESHEVPDEDAPAEDKDEDKQDEDADDEDEASESPRDGKGLKITIEGFPEDIDGVHRGGLNGDYFQDLTGNCIQGHPTYWQKEKAGTDDVPFIYYCGTNSSTKLIHQKWAISNKHDFEKIQAGQCQTFAPFPAEEDLRVDLGVTAVHMGTVDGVAKGWAVNEDWVKDIRISAIEAMDESPSVNCAE